MSGLLPVKNGFLNRDSKFTIEEFPVSDIVLGRVASLFHLIMLSVKTLVTGNTL